MPTVTATAATQWDRTAAGVDREVEAARAALHAAGGVSPRLTATAAEGTAVALCDLSLNIPEVLPSPCDRGHAPAERGPPRPLAASGSSSYYGENTKDDCCTYHASSTFRNFYLGCHDRTRHETSIYYSMVLAGHDMPSFSAPVLYPSWSHSSARGSATQLPDVVAADRHHPACCCSLTGSTSWTKFTSVPLQSAISEGSGGEGPPPQHLAFGSSSPRPAAPPATATAAPSSAAPGPPVGTLPAPAEKGALQCMAGSSQTKILLPASCHNSQLTSG